MGLAPELESQLQAARLEALVPVLGGLGVEAIADLEFVQESDLENQESITTLQKRRFCDWKKKTLEEQSKSSPTNETRQGKQSNPKKTRTCSKSTVLSTCSKPEALHPYGSQPRDPALDVDFHKIFGDPSLSADDVKSLYHDLCKKHHPDKGGNAEVFSRITKAYNVVVDPLESYLGAEATHPPPMTKIKEEEGREAAVVPSPSPADTLLEKSASMHMDNPFVPKRRGFRASLKLCFASVL